MFFIFLLPLIQNLTTPFNFNMNIKVIKGFTLVELMIGIVVLMIIVSIAIPAYHTTMARLEAQRITTLIQTVLRESRSHAFTQHQRLAICGSLDGQICDANAWDQGLLIFHDQTANRLRDPQEPIHQFIKLQLKYGAFSWRGFGVATNILFQPDTGLPRGSNGSFKYCAKNEINSRKIILSDMGHSRVETGTC
ncbi:MAG: prepilin-type N-terminal cleavage/methylation domain-containing protein [Acinetobacter sp.]|jgi:prepilin-type N-terminal cleavage/methylation domain-containing protein|nr:MAG: prepilin-type N-terminal cleavage/methylation domain-containing protein [Acinetobacter sp.]